jgi:hypothetical protein
MNQGNSNQRLPKILVNSVPKSGTNLLVQVIEGIPGMEKDRFYRKDTNYLRSLNLRPGKFGVGHISYDKNYARRLKAKGIKHIFIYRDPRDIVVSWTYFLLNSLPDHAAYPLFKNRLKTHHERLMTAITGFEVKNSRMKKKHGIRNVKNIYDRYKHKFAWINDHNVCLVRYEDLVKGQRSRRRTLRQIVNFLWSDLKTLGRSKSYIVRQMEKSIKPNHSRTFRKGKTGEWRKEFNENHKNEFKKVAGDLLIKLGYEKNNDW